MVIRILFFGLLVGWQIAVSANYLEVRRNAYVYESPNRSSTRLEHIQPNNENAPVYFVLAQEGLVNGYYQVTVEDGYGWIYKSLVRQYEGFPPGYVTKPSLNISNAEGAINIYFNKAVLTDYALPGNEANGEVNLEDRLISRIRSAQTSIDVAVYEINLPRVVEALIDKASKGVDVRVIADAKSFVEGVEDKYLERYDRMRIFLEKLTRGQDGQFQTDDDIALFSDGLMLAVDDPQLRQKYDLPSTPSGLPFGTYQVGQETLTGYLLAKGELRREDEYYKAAEQMHNKFAIIDKQWVFTGSWNWTVTGLYGSEDNRSSGKLDGNQQHVVEVSSLQLAAAYTTEFNEMWGADTLVADANNANFHSRKTDNTEHAFVIGGKKVELYFSPGDDALNHVNQLVNKTADRSVYFSIFAWSDQSLVDTLKLKWEGSAQDQVGTLTGFDIRGVFDSSFWNQFWSASINMTGRTASKVTANIPNLRWANPAPVYRDNEPHKLHSKTFLIDACTNSDPTVVIGSTNWSNNGNSVNDENLLVIHDEQIANQFLQEFYARYQSAGGVIPNSANFSCYQTSY